MENDDDYNTLAINAKVKNLCATYPMIFKHIFHETDSAPNIDPDVTQQAETKYNELYPNDEDTLTAVIEHWKKMQMLQKCKLTSDLDQRSVDCKSVFNPSIRNYDPTFFAPPTKRRRNDKFLFETAEFLLNAKRNNENIPLRWDTDMGEYINNLYYDEEKDKKYLIADQSLRKIAKIVKTLNEKNLYRMMDLNPERIIK